MYKLHLILKYLAKRRIAWVSLIAVTLCTALVLVVISVMGGWLRMARQSFHGLAGDVIITSRSLSGFAHYQEFVREVQKLPQVEAAVPVLRTFGLIKINNGNPDAVQVLGYPVEQIGRVNNFPQSLHRQYEAPLSAGQAPPAPSFNLVPGKDYKELASYRLPKARGAENWPGMIVGAGVVGISKDKDGNIDRPAGLLDAFVRLEVMGLSGEEISLETARPTPNYYWIVDDSRTQMWQLDSKTVYVAFDVLQQDLRMAERSTTNPDTGEKIVRPARTTDIYIKARPDADLEKLKEDVTRIVAARYPLVLEPDAPIAVQTWEETNRTWLGAIEKEKSLVTFLFGMISIVAVFQIFCIFYMIVVEKTRDIGIIKSIGATSRGVAGIFLGYGLVIGVVGSLMGLGVGFLIVHYINEIHTALGKLTGTVIWNPEVYAFDVIPNTMNPNEVFWIVLIAILSSVLGALVPAIRAAGMHPVDSLRWE
ncbi:MAG TPA: FtsX-like permease family protein [Tepidisphaeraceae bacterium]|nr:FtsX-like permease family protein [Tepidisphaeraceae bacterium]